MSYSEVITKKNKPLNEMSLDELRAAAEDQGLKFYRDKAAADPTNEQARQELEQYAAQRGIILNPVVNRLYELPIDQLRNEFETKGAAQEAESLEQYRTKQARQWIASQPRYIPTPESADKIVAKLDSMGFRGSVFELDAAFNALVDAGEIDAPPIPVKLYRDDELRSMPLNQMKEYFEKRGI
jgi:hypothetical protein